jgi:actin-like ATPase involved in cell morphogenesis
MDNMINYGIDLGTTNSSIAKFVKGEVEVFKNPMETGKETLPSVVYYKKDKIFVGSSALTYLEKDTKNVFSSFKRKMGTTESFRVKSLDQIKTPIELSAEIIKELKGFVHTGEQVDAAVITIPASFGIIQSNATKEAGLLAGFKQVVLLQEPIAASLAYANKHKEKKLEDGKWLVYDLGGGTFDVALIKIQDGEMKILDHEGDNFLGGTDFDNLMVEKMIIPFLNKYFKFNNLEDELKSESGKYNSLYIRLLRIAELAKIRLSAKTSAEIELIDIIDDNGENIDISFEITRSEFDSLIKADIDRTTEMIKKILVRNSLKPSDIQFTLMVGGSTYIPYVRKRVEEILQIPVNCNIDPTTAIAIGAAYYAGTKEKNIKKEISKPTTSGLKIRFSYQKTSQELDEMLAVRVDGNIEGLFYQITREDKGYDSGRKKLTARISVDLPLLKESYNFFKFTILDEHNNIIETDIDLIGIIHGKIVFHGQPLSNDICIEIDAIPEFDNGLTTFSSAVNAAISASPAIKKGLIAQTYVQNVFKGSKILPSGTENWQAVNGLSQAVNSAKLNAKIEVLQNVSVMKYSDLSSNLATNYFSLLIQADNYTLAGVEGASGGTNAHEVISVPQFAKGNGLARRIYPNSTAGNSHAFFTIGGVQKGSFVPVLNGVNYKINMCISLTRSIKCILWVYDQGTADKKLYLDADANFDSSKNFICNTLNGEMRVIEFPVQLLYTRVANNAPTFKFHVDYRPLALTAFPQINGVAPTVAQTGIVIDYLEFIPVLN